ncbi:hypothetical protein CEV33_2690 [Brucella grignonensis]|uniref:Uncharacterized protein n=1 Tax=Brucella grignonensis TaxID=94627 RepID=A0A256F272_9HYPH|nr:hypothetical protein CEV33_2690 [Brucella grignonensis]
MTRNVGRRNVGQTISHGNVPERIKLGNLTVRKLVIRWARFITGKVANPSTMACAGLTRGFSVSTHLIKREKRHAD